MGTSQLDGLWFLCCNFSSFNLNIFILHNQWQTIFNAIHFCYCRKGRFKPNSQSGYFFVMNFSYVKLLSFSFIILSFSLDCLTFFSFQTISDPFLLFRWDLFCVAYKMMLLVLLLMLVMSNA